MTSKKFILFSIFFYLILLSSCYHTRLITKEDAETDFKKETVHSLFWGLLQENIPAKNCNSGLSEVRYSTNLGYILLSTITLGIWVPMEVEWKCAVKAPPNIEDK